MLFTCLIIHVAVQDYGDDGDAQVAGHPDHQLQTFVFPDLANYVDYHEHLPSWKMQKQT